VDYTVKQGDCIESIAVRHGLLWQTIWDDPNNAELKRRREDPHVLLPGDPLYIPGRRVKSVDGATDQRHRFRRRGVPWRFRHHRYFKAAPFEATQGAAASSGSSTGNAKACSFPSNAITVTPLTPVGRSKLTSEIRFRNGQIRAGLATYVLDFYKKANLKHLYAVTIAAWCGWEIWLKLGTKAERAWVHDGGVIAEYPRRGDADNEKECDEPWEVKGLWQCWVRRRSKARNAFAAYDMIVAAFDNREDAEAESTQNFSTKQRLWLAE